jgi:hypothetical protein
MRRNNTRNRANEKDFFLAQVLMTLKSQTFCRWLPFCYLIWFGGLLATAYLGSSCVAGVCAK